jgi:phosphopantothenoylcysteine synthetase/decarboxylase
LAGKLKDRKVLVTSGPTQAEIDRVRYITNKSTGKLGAKIASEFLRQGAQVTFIYGQGSELPQIKKNRLKVIKIRTVPEFIQIIKQELSVSQYDIVIQAMAVLDYIPKHPSSKKFRSQRKVWTIKLIRTPKVIKIIRELLPKAFLVSFKLEVGKEEKELIKTAYRSLKENKVELVVANDLDEIEKGRHTGYIINKEGRVIKKAIGKDKIAQELVSAINACLKKEA